MNTFVAFFKDMFSSDGNNDIKVGLSQFKNPAPTGEKETAKINNFQADIKLSDLMRKNY